MSGTTDMVSETLEGIIYPQNCAIPISEKDCFTIWCLFGAK